MSTMITRAQWGAKAPKDVTTVPIGARTATCVHHDGAFPVAVSNLADACELMRRDQRLHMVTNGWADIGYNFLVISSPGNAIDGAIMEGRGRDVVGAHCLNWNTPWIGIQVAVGGAQRPSDAALYSVRVLHDACAKGAGHTLAKKAHSDGFATACPGDFLRAWCRAGMPVTTTIIPIPVIVTVTNAVKAVAKAPARVVAALSHKIVVDGIFGPATVRDLQTWVYTRADGMLGTNSWKAIQHRLGITADGVPGPNTWKSIQRLVGVRADGIPGPVTIKALQRYLNAR